MEVCYLEKELREHYIEELDEDLIYILKIVHYSLVNEEGFNLKVFDRYSRNFHEVISEHLTVNLDQESQIMNILLDALKALVEEIQDWEIDKSLDIYKSLADYEEKDLTNLKASIRSAFSSCVAFSIVFRIKLLSKYHDMAPSNLDEEDIKTYQHYYVNTLAEEYNKVYPHEKCISYIRKFIYRILVGVDKITDFELVTKFDLNYRIDITKPLILKSKTINIEFTKEDLKDLHLLITDRDFTSSTSLVTFLDRALYLLGLEKE